MQKIEQTLDSREVAEMIKKDHAMLLRDLRRYEKQFTECKIAVSDFFLKSEYKDSTGRTLPCYQITLKGCEFIAHKMTGTRGTEFTARYINRFHEMQDMITGQAAGQEPEIPWFIKKLEGEYVVLERDFIQLTGVDIRKYKGFYGKLKHGDYNGIGWKPNVDDELFRQKYGFEYGDEKILMYFYLNRVKNAFDILASDRSIHMNPEAYKLLKDGIVMIQKPKCKVLEVQKVDTQIPAVVEPKQLPKQISINIVLGDVAEVEVK